MTDSKEEKQKKTIKNKINVKYLFIFTIFIISVFTIIVPFYTFEIFQNIKQQKTYVNDQIEEFKKQQAIILNRIDKLNTNLAEKDKNIHNRFETVNHKVRLALQEHGKAPIDWKLFKAHYYLKLAEMNALWSKNDSKTTIALLSETDVMLSKFNDQKIITLRQDIAKEISQLKSYPNVDTENLLEKLDAAQKMVNQITISKPEFKPEITTTETTKKSAWQQHISTSIDILKKLVVVHKNTDSINYLLSPLYATTVKEIIILNLQQAQRAVLNKNEQLFKLSIQQAMSNIKSYLNQQEAREILIKNLSEIETINITSPTTNIQHLQSLLTEIISNQSSELLNEDTKITGDN